MGWFLRKKASLKKALRKRFKTKNRNKTHDDQPQARPVKKMGWFVKSGAAIKNAWIKRIQTKNRNKNDDDQSQARPGKNMGCFPWAGDLSIKKAERKSIQNRTDDDQPQARPFSFGKVVTEFTDMLKGSQGKVVNKEEAKDAKQSTSKDGITDGIKVDDIKLRMFKFSELFIATENFKEELGRGGFGKVYKGCFLETDETVAVKRLDRNGSQGIMEFFVEIFTLRKADHPNLVKLIGCCAEKDQRILVYEYVPLGSLDNHLHDLRPNGKRLDWNTRMKIAADAARGLEYLHDKMKPPVIYRDMKCSNILLGEGYNAKLSDFGFAKVGPIGDETHVSTRLMGTYGYCAPEYAMTGQLTLKSDIYNFGVVLLEIITGRKAMDSLERSLVSWARPLLKGRKKFRQLADRALAHQYPVRGLYQYIAIAALCVHEQPNARPVIADVVRALDYLASQKYEPETAHSSRKNSSTPIPKVNLDVTKKRHRLKVTGNDRTNPVKSHTGNSCPVIKFGATQNNSFSPKSSRAYMSA